MVKLREKTTQKLEGKVRFRRWKNMTVGARISLVVLLLVILMAVFANFIAPHNPYEIFTARQAPNSEFLFGTDDNGRDVQILSGVKPGVRVVVEGAYHVKLASASNAIPAHTHEH